MTVRRVLVAVDDSPAALRAALVAFELAAGWRARVRVITVTHDHRLGALLDTVHPDEAVERLQQASRALLRHLTHTARSQGLDVDDAQLTGEPFRQILDHARLWQADIIVMGRSDRSGPSSPYLGSVTARVLEFTERPVLVVPRPDIVDPRTVDPSRLPG